jgi:hypothetical protein
MNQNHEYNYDIPFDNRTDEPHFETSKDVFAPHAGQFSFKPKPKMGGYGKNKHYMKFT